VRNILSDEDYVKCIKGHNNGTMPKECDPTLRYYVITKSHERDLYGESTDVLSSRLHLSHLIALVCLSTSQRQSSLRNQPQTKRIGRLLFENLYISTLARAIKGAETGTTEKEWFINLFPEATEWPEICWRREFDSIVNRLDGKLYSMPIILRPEFFEF
jgi:hypothetical protein